MKQKIYLAIGVVLLASSVNATKAIDTGELCQNIEPPAVFISEIGWAGSTKSTADEWLELFNQGEDETDLSGWTIEGAGTGGSTLTLPGNSVLSPGKAYLIANYSAESASSLLAIAPNYINNALSLSNSTLRLVLKDKNGCQADEAGDGQAPFFGGTGVDGTVSMVRLLPLLSGGVAEAWTAASASSGFDNGAAELGTPGTLEISIIAETVETEKTETEEIEETETTVNAETNTDAETNPETETATKAETEEFQQEEVENQGVTNETESEATPSISEETTETETITETESQTSIEETTTETENPTEEIVTENPPTPESAPSTTSIFYPIGTLMINEFVSDPIKEEKEWVEIINPYNNVISLAGWKISEGSGRSVAFPEILLGYGQITVVEFSSGALNNDSDEISLLDPNGTVIDKIIYGRDEIPIAKDPFSVAKNYDGKFLVTETPTKGGLNVITTTIVVTEKEKTKKGENNEKPETKTETCATETPKTEPPTVRFSKLYPNPEGSDATDEFIELENFGTEEVDLFGLSVEDAAGNDWKVSEHTKATPNARHVISRTEYQFALNNSKNETVRLYAADGSLLDQIQYENAPKNSIYARDKDSWHWVAQITANEPEKLPEDDAADRLVMAGQTSDSTDDVGTPAPESPASVTLVQARQLEPESKVMTKGIVSVKPGILGRQIFYLADNQAGIQIYKSDAAFPDLEIGDLVELSGTISSNRSEPRIKIGRDDEIKIIDSDQAVTVLEVQTVSEEEAGQLARVAGMITEKSSDRLTLENNGGLTEIRIKEGTEIKLTDLKPGDKITITGLVGQSENKFFLLPRSMDDLTPEPAVEETVVAVTSEPTGKQTAEHAKENKAITIGLTVIVVLTGHAIYRRWQRRRLSKISSDRTKPDKKQLYDKNRGFSFTPAE